MTCRRIYVSENFQAGATALKAIAVHPGQGESVHLADLAKPSIGEVKNGRGVLVKVLEVGVDGTDKEINEALYGEAPPGSEFLVIGHESFGIVEAVGPNVTELKPGDFVAATVRRPGASLFDTIGTYDMTTDKKYYERGISCLHGFLTEYYVDEPEYLVKVPASLKHIGVLMEPMSIVEKGIVQAYEIQRRLRVWRPKKALVLGAGAIGQLATLVLRLKGIEVVTMARSPAPHLKASQVEDLGATYIDTTNHTLDEVSDQHGPFDLVFEATGVSWIAFKSLEVLDKNGVLILTSITGGDKKVEIPADKINLEFVLYNKVMFGTVNANREYFELGVKDFAHAEAEYAGWLARLLSHPVSGLDNFETMMNLLTTEKQALKVFMQVNPVERN